MQNQRYFVQRNNTTVFIREQLMSSFEFKTVKITSIKSAFQPLTHTHTGKIERDNITEKISFKS